MNTLRQAAQQALEALDTLYRSLSPESVLAADLKRRADALREALEQPEQAPVAWQGLTPDETMLLMNQTAGQHWADEAHIQRFRAALEYKLKEKNT